MAKTVKTARKATAPAKTAVARKTVKPAAKAVPATAPRRGARPTVGKNERVFQLLKRPTGATRAELREITGWAFNRTFLDKVTATRGHKVIDGKGDKLRAVAA